MPLVEQNGTEVETMKSNVVKISTSGVGAIVGKCGVIGSKGSIKVLGLAGSTVSVYAANGVCMAQETPDSPKYEINVPAGVYLVHFNGKSVKVIVK
ncbi:MAG: hypothetical protein K2H18_03045 [Muribaculaceae bacterium]|nr:hypothetical protein [Muribaculaceae bacterium]